MTTEALKDSLVLAAPDMKTLTLDENQVVDVAALDGALDEGRAIAGMLGAHLISGRDVRLDNAFDRCLNRAPIIHLATHGYAFTDLGEDYYSFLLLVSGSMYGQMTVRYIINNETPFLKADLVVLSACETGSGAVTGMEGVLGLQRAFLSKGERTVIASLWTVSDHVTYLLMKSFYTHLLLSNVKPAKAEALRLAQLEIRERYPEPFYWAGFQVFGGS